jgi:hypothetical protein
MDQGKIGVYPDHVVLLGSSFGLVCTHIPSPVLPEALESPVELTSFSFKIFALIGTVTLIVTIFKAAWPPQALIACGTEGGMEHVLTCSYDWTLGILYRDAIARQHWQGPKSQWMLASG